MLAKKINLCIINLFNESRVQLEFAELDLRDAKEQAMIDKINIESGVVTVNEARKKRVLLPREETSDEPSQEVGEDKKFEFLSEEIIKPKNGKSKRELSLHFR